jgi:RNA polymerase sigma factor (sigma-70 family)
MRRSGISAQEMKRPSETQQAEYPAALHTYLVRQLRNRQDAQDLAQEAYVRYLQLPNSAAVRNPAAYLFRIAFNLMTEWRLRRDRSVVCYDSDLMEQHASAAAPAPGPVEQLLQRERLERVLEQIPLNYRRVLIMSKCDGLSNEEIAATLKVSAHTVVRYLGRAVAFARRARWD